MHWVRPWLAATLMVSSACASIPASAPPANPPVTPPAAPAPSQAAEPAKPEPPAPEVKAALPLPTRCTETKSSKICLPDQTFVDRLCGGSWPDIALAFFRKESPWTRAYAVRAVSAWNASGGAMSTSAKLVVHEELIVLKHRASAGGIVVSGASGGFDVLRWDGTCVSLSGDEVSLRRPGLARFAPIPWRKLAEKTQTSLLSDARIKQGFDRRRKECQGESSGPGVSSCERAEADLSAGIVSFIRGGGAIPDPSDLP